MAPLFVPEPGSPVVVTLGMNVVQLINLPVFLPRSQYQSMARGGERRPIGVNTEPGNPASQTSARSVN